MEIGSTALSWAAITAGGAAVGAFWGQIKGFLVRFNSLFIVSTEIEDEAGTALAFYLFDHLYRSPLGKMKYKGHEAFVRPLDGYYVVAFEQLGPKMTFFDGWKPIFVSTDEQSNHRVSISFLRGTFDLKQLINDSVDYYNDFIKGKQEVKRKRYRVNKIFGQYGSGHGKEDDSRAELSNSSEVQLKPLKWTRDELGSPIKEEPFDSLFYGKVEISLLEEIDMWVKSGDWFKEKGLPNQLGVGLEGPPGTGKSSFIRAVGQKYDFPVDHYDLSSLSNEEFVSNWRDSLNRAPCIVLFEDFDRVFHKDKMVNEQNTLNKGRLTLDCILNCIQGVESSDGILTFITVNDVTKLDEAIGNFNEKGESTRPGRLDRIVTFGPMEEQARRAMAGKILDDTPELIDKMVAEGDGDTGAQFSKRCADIAKAKWWERFNNKEIETSELDPDRRKKPSWATTTPQPTLQSKKIYPAKKRLHNGGKPYPMPRKSGH